MMKGTTLSRLKYAPALLGGALLGGYISSPERRERLKSHFSNLSYLLRHKANILGAMREAGTSLPQAALHDVTKFRFSEFPYYSRRFSGKFSPEDFREWRKAVRKHYSHPLNLHHYKKLGLDPSSVPLKYRVEAVADWYSVGKTRGRYSKDFRKWYSERREKLPIDPETRSYLDLRLGMEKKAISPRTIFSAMGKAGREVRDLENRIGVIFDNLSIADVEKVRKHSIDPAFRKLIRRTRQEELFKSILKKKNLLPGNN